MRGRPGHLLGLVLDHRATGDEALGFQALPEDLKNEPIEVIAYLQ